MPPVTSAADRKHLLSNNHVLADSAHALDKKLASPKFQKTIQPLKNTLAVILTGSMDGVTLTRTAPVMKAVLALIDLHPLAQDDRRGAPFDVWLDTRSPQDNSKMAREAGVILTAGALALGTRSPTLTPGAINAVLGIALGADLVSVILRATFLDRLKSVVLEDPLGGLTLGFWVPPSKFECAGRLRGALSELAGFAATLSSDQPRVPVVDAASIASISPSTGCCNTSVTLTGNFVTPQPSDMYVAFPTNEGHTAPATVVLGGWSGNHITVLTPGNVGDGPVGLVTDPESTRPLNVSAGVEFGQVLSECIGPGSGVVSRLVAGMPPRVVLRIPPSIPATANNIFHGGPVLQTVTPAVATRGDVLIIGGLNLTAADTVCIDGIALATTFVNVNQLTAVLDGSTISGGPRLVSITRGACTSNTRQIEVRASMPAPGPLRYTVSQNFTIYGFGFEEFAMSVTINGEPTHVKVVSPNELQIQAIRPRAVPPIADPAGEQVTVSVSHRGNTIGTFALDLETYRILAFGDSIMWGQGLLEEQKFPALARSFAPSNQTPYFIDRSAHSGAKVLPRADSATPLPQGFPFNVVPPGVGVPLLGAIGGEIPHGSPTIADMVAEWLSLSQEVRDTVDLIILNGGINDVDPFKIILPDPDDTDLLTKTPLIIKNPKNWKASEPTLTFNTPDPWPPAADAPALPPAALETDLLSWLVAINTAFSRPSLRVVVCGYYQIISNKTDPANLYSLLAPLSIGAGIVLSTLPLPLDPGLSAIVSAAAMTWARDRSAARSLLFANGINHALQAAVNEMHALPGGQRFAFADPGFGPMNAVFAPNSYLFACGFNGLDPIAIDPVAAARFAALSPGAERASIKNRLASVAHPNAKGAQAYADAIHAALLTMP